MAGVYCVCISYIVHKYTSCCICIPCFRPAVPFLHRLYTVPLCRHAISIPIYTQQQPYTAIPCHAACILLSIGIYRTFSHAPPHMPLRRSYFNSEGLLLLGYKYPASVAKMRYSLILAVWWLLLDVRLFWCCYRYAVYRVLHGVGWGIYYILRGAGYSPYHTPHIKRGGIRRLACVRPLLARLS